MLKGCLTAAAAFVACAPASAVTTLYTVSGTISGLIVEGSGAAFNGSDPLNVDLAGETFDLTFNAGLYDDGEVGIPGYGPTYVDGSFYFTTRQAYPHMIGTAWGDVFGQTRSAEMDGSFLITDTSLELRLYHQNQNNGVGELTLRATRLGNQFVNWTGTAAGYFELRTEEAYNSATFARFRGVDVAVTVVGAPAIPEPATWALMIAGFGLAGTAMRRHAVNRTVFA
jgi:hypothetical protein